MNKKNYDVQNNNDALLYNENKYENKSMHWFTL